MKTPDSVPPPLSNIEELKFEIGVAAREKYKPTQDAYFSLPEKGAFAVFDGVSGPGGEVASANARDFISNFLSGLPKDLTEEELKNKLREALQKAHEFIFGTVGTTATIAQFTGRKIVVANVGDSRVYRIRGGELEQMTIDDNVLKYDLTEMGRANEIRSMQKKLNNTLSKEELTTEEYAFFYLRNQMSQAVGVKCVPDVFVIDYKPGDIILLSSDGIHDNLTDSRQDGLTPSIQDILKMKTSSQEMADSLAQAAYEKSKLGGFRAKPDDITALVIKSL